MVIFYDSGIIMTAFFDCPRASKKALDGASNIYPDRAWGHTEVAGDGNPSQEENTTAATKRITSRDFSHNSVHTTGGGEPKNQIDDSVSEIVPVEEKINKIDIISRDYIHLGFGGSRRSPTSVSMIYYWFFPVCSHTLRSVGRSFGRASPLVGT